MSYANNLLKTSQCCYVQFVNNINCQLVADTNCQLSLIDDLDEFTLTTMNSESNV